MIQKTFQKFALPAVLLIALVPSLVLAQYSTGRIIGTIEDPAGAMVPGVGVTLTNDATGETRNFTTDAEGGFQFRSLQAGTYTLRAKAASFKTATVPNIVVRVNMEARVDVRMELGAVTDTVEVKATTPQLQTDTAAMGTVVDNRTLLELPLNQRNFFDLAALTPGSLKTAGGSSVMDGRSADLGGVRNLSTSAMMDGTDFSVRNVNNPAIAMSLDAISEFKVQLNFMDAAYGHGAGGYELVTRRGGNDFHGVLYEFLRNRAFNSGNFFRPTGGEPRFSYNQFGAGGGGKIIRDKLFYFVNYEGRRRRTGVIQQGWLPAAATHDGDFSGLGKTLLDPMANYAPFGGNQVPKSRWDPVATNMLSLIPTPNAAGIRPGINYVTTPSPTAQERRDQGTGRVDWVVSPQGSFFARYSIADDVLGDPSYRPNKGMLRPDRTQSVAIGYTHLASSNLILDTRLGLTRAFLARTSDGDNTSTDLATALGFKNLRPNPGEYTEPAFGLANYSPGLGGYNGRIVQNNTYGRISETLTYIRGSHSLKVGGEIARIFQGMDQGSDQDGTINFNTLMTGDSMANFLLGYVASASAGLGSLLPELGGVGKYAITNTMFWFVQDDWKITPRLTLNLGLRWEYEMPYRGRFASFDLGTGRQLIAGSPDYYIPGQGYFRGSGAPLLPERPMRADKNNYAPRLGIAYRIGEKTTVRAGAGVFYGMTQGTDLATWMSTPPFFMRASLTVPNSNVPSIFLKDLFPPAESQTTGVSSNIDLNRRTPYIYQYNLNVQRQVTPGLLAEFGYMGNTGQKQWGTLMMNQPSLPLDPAHPSPITSRMPYPTLSPGFSQSTNYQYSNYNAGYIKFEKRAASGLTFTASYTYSKLIDVGAGQNMYDRRSDRALAGNDVRHNFIAGYVWELPVGRGRYFEIRNAVLNGVAGGWQISGLTNFRTGMPTTPGTSGDISRVSVGGGRANATGATPKLMDPRQNNMVAIDRSAFALPAIGTFGNAGRDVQPTFGVNQWDVGIDKNFSMNFLGEGGRFQVRAEFFNFFNHTQFAGFGMTVNVPSSYGIVTSARDPRIFQLATKLYW